MLTRKDFIKKADEFINTYKNENAWVLSQIWVNQISDYCKIAKNSNPRFDEIRFRDWVEKGIYE